MRAAAKWLGGATLFVCLAAIIAGVVIVRRIDAPYQGFAGPEQFVEIAPGTGSTAIGRRLVEAGVISDEQTFRLALWYTGRSRALQAGEYRFDRPASAREVIARVASGDVYVRRLTFPEGLTIGEMARLFESRGFGSARDFERATRDASLIKDIDPGAGDLEGYLFPETYPIARGTAASHVIAMMVNRFRATYAELARGVSGDSTLTTRQIVTLASLVEKETAKAEERPIVAGVYRNRLAIGMGLQADPTVVYALRKAGRYDGNIRRQDLQTDSPYNTYRYGGLPPGPIAAPGKASLAAALTPARVPYLYFVSRNDGSHVFAETLGEHNRNVRRYQILYFRR